MGDAGKVKHAALSAGLAGWDSPLSARVHPGGGTAGAWWEPQCLHFHLCKSRSQFSPSCSYV